MGRFQMNRCADREPDSIVLSRSKNSGRLVSAFTRLLVWWIPKLISYYKQPRATSKCITWFAPFECLTSVSARCLSSVATASRSMIHQMYR